jgi:hypothetical protein
MGMNSVYISIDESSLDKLWELEDQQFRDHVLEIEEDDRFSRLDIGKIWDVLHCTTTGVSASEPIEGDKLSEAFVGVFPKIFDDEDDSMFISVIENGDLQSICSAVSEFDLAKLTAAFDPKLLQKKKVYPRGIWKDDPTNLIAELNTALRDIEVFFATAHKAEQHILATIL